MRKGISRGTAEKSIWFRNLGGPSLFPYRIWGARSGLVIVALLALGVLCVDQLALRARLMITTPPPSPSPAPIHFAIDDLDLGPKVRLTRFVPTFEPSRAVEGASGLLYVSYAPAWPPRLWHQIGGEASRLGVLDEGRISPIEIAPDARMVNIEGLLNGMPVVAVYGVNGKTHFVAIGTHGLQPLSGLPRQLQYPPPCVPFAGGRICDEHEPGLYYGVRITTRTGRSIFVGGESYSYDVISYADAIRQTRTVTETGDVRVVGGGPHRFLLVEDQAGRGTAECLEGFTP